MIRNDDDWNCLTEYFIVLIIFLLQCLIIRARHNNCYRKKSMLLPLRMLMKALPPRNDVGKTIAPWGQMASLFR